MQQRHPSYAEMYDFIVSTGAPLEATPFIDEGIYYYAKKRGWQDVVEQCPFVPPALDVLSSESIGALVFEMLEDEYEVLPDRVMDNLLTGKGTVEDSDLYDKE